MYSLMLPASNASQQTWLKRVPLSSRKVQWDEPWLQGLLFDNPSLVPVEEISPGARGFVPICRELTIPKSGPAVFLDVLGVTPEGRLVLIECKLWKNPQARREVIAQILEYASLMRHWTFGDLLARVKHTTGSSEKNPIFSEAAKMFPEIDEATFVDRVSSSLRKGDFLLIIAGDGIRSDVHAIADHLNETSGLMSRMALVEFQLWQGDDGALVIIPAVPLRTELIKHHVWMSDNGVPLHYENASDSEEDVESALDPSRNASKQRDREFWQSFIDQVKFDHPDQPPPRYGGHGWVKIEMPAGLKHFTAYRTKAGRGGIFGRFKDDKGAEIFSEIEAAKSQLEADLGFSLSMEVVQEEPFVGMVSIEFNADPFDDSAFLQWLLDRANRCVNTFRPFLAQVV